MSEPLAIARDYLRALERFAAGDELRAYFTPEAIFEELPNRITPQGAKRDLDGIEEGSRRGRSILTEQRFDVQRELAAGDRVVFEVIWTGTLAVPIGSIPAGGTLRAFFAMFLDFRDGRIAYQRNYDCFEPF